MVVDPEVQTVSVIKTSLLFIQLQLSVIFTASEHDLNFWRAVVILPVITMVSAQSRWASTRQRTRTNSSYFLVLSFYENSLLLIYPSLEFQNRLEILLQDDRGRSILDKDYLELR